MIKNCGIVSGLIFLPQRRLVPLNDSDPFEVNLQLKKDKIDI